MPIHKIEKQYIDNITQHQREEMLSVFEQDKDGAILIPYEHKGYTCNDINISFNSKVKAISMFSGAGGLDIGTQLAGVKVIASLDVFEDSVEITLFRQAKKLVDEDAMTTMFKYIIDGFTFLFFDISSIN